MALTPLRWIAATVAGCLVAAALALSVSIAERRWSSNERDYLVARINSFERAGVGNARRLRTQQVIDSLQRVLGQMPSGTSSRVLVDRRFSRREEFASVISSRLAPGGSIAGSPIDVVLLLDSLSLVRGRMTSKFDRVTHVLPGEPGQRCLAVMRYSDFRQGSNFAGHYTPNDPHAMAEILGPCAYYAAFGQPGVGIDRWLHTEAVVFAMHAPGFRMRFVPEDFYWGDRFLTWGRAAGFPVRRQVGTATYACTTGDRDACLLAIAKPMMSRRRLGLEQVEKDGSITRPLASDRYFSPSTLGIAGNDLLSDMVASIGGEKFRRFWTSSEAPPEAFKAATGQDLGDWMTGWASERYGAHERGPGVDAGGAVVSILVAFAALAAATVASRRRQVA